MENYEEMEVNLFIAKPVMNSKHGNLINLFRVASPQKEFYYKRKSMSISIQEYDYLNQFDPNTTNVVIVFKDPENQELDKHPTFAGKLYDFHNKVSVVNRSKGFAAFNMYQEN